MAARPTRPRTHQPLS